MSQITTYVVIVNTDSDFDKTLRQLLIVNDRERPAMDVRYWRSLVGHPSESVLRLALGVRSFDSDELTLPPDI